MKSAQATARDVRAGTLSAVDVVRAALTRLDEVAHLNATLHRDDAGALEAAAAVDRAVAAGADPGALAGVPVALKDNYCDTDAPCTCGSRILEGYTAPYTATAVQRLRDAGAIVVARTNMDEFAMGSSNENSAFGPVSNPWDTDRVPGGSSGGSAALVAAGVVPIALGSSTGGSVRQPASFTGVVGLKPTYGRISRHGLVAYASSLDVVAPLGRSVEDAALALSVMAGVDPLDATSLDTAVEDYPAATEMGVKGLRVGLLTEALGEGNEAETTALVREGSLHLQKAGAEISEVSLPALSHAIPCYYVLAPAEASSNLARFDGIRYGPREPADDLASLYKNVRTGRFGPEVKRRILMGTFCLSAGYHDAYYIQALAAQALLKKQLAALFRQVDLLLLPTAPSTAFRKGELVEDPLAMYLSDIYTVTANLTGTPAISVPCGLANGLPVGLQLMAPPLGEARLVAAAGVVERAVGLLTPPSQ
jgi:aspartyl-tRNA(Asn)/glutamyl-tRNA(Gln) amidotransferase subunit A